MCMHAGQARQQQIRSDRITYPAMEASEEEDIAMRGHFGVVSGPLNARQGKHNGT